MQHPSIPSATLLLALFAAGCATTGALHTESSTAAIRSAEELGARAVPQASLHLQLAEEEMKLASQLNTAGKDAEAGSMLTRAQADAELAIALSRADTERRDAEAARERVVKLRAENPYSPGGAP